MTYCVYYIMIIITDGGSQSRPVQVANHKAILGLSICPLVPHQLASYAEVHTHTHSFIYY